MPARRVEAPSARRRSRAPLLIGTMAAVGLLATVAVWRSTPHTAGLVATSRDERAATAKGSSSLPELPPEGPPGAVPRIEDLDALDAAVREAVLDTVAGVERRPDDAGAWGALGIVYQAHRYFSLAERCHLEARRLDPRAPEWPHLLGILAEERGDAERAASFYRESVERARSVDRAVSTPEPASAMDQVATAATYRLGNALLVAGDVDGAERAFTELDRSRPNEPWGALGLGRVAQRRGSAEQAVRHLERALAADPDSAQAAYLLATAYRQAGRGAEARPLVERAREGVKPAYPADPILDRVRAGGRGLQAVVEAANQALAAGNVSAAEAAYLEVLRTDPGYHDALFNLGLLYGRQQRFEESQAMLERAVAARPESSQARLLLALSLASQDRLEEARAQLRELLERDPEHVEAVAMLEEMEH